MPCSALWLCPLALPSGAHPHAANLFPYYLLTLQISDRTFRASYLAPTVKVLTEGGTFSVLAVLLKRGVASLVDPDATPVRHGVQFVEAVLYLASAVVTNSAGAQAALDIKLVQLLLPLIKDAATDHLGALARALALLENLAAFR